VLYCLAFLGAPAPIRLELSVVHFPLDVFPHEAQRVREVDTLHLRFKVVRPLLTPVVHLLDGRPVDALAAQWSGLSWLSPVPTP
jgi:hypothetical protein